MANVKFTTGNISSLPTELSAGTVYFAITDEINKKGKIIFDKDNFNRYEMSGEISLSSNGFALCETDSLTKEKEIVLQNDWALKIGSVIYIMFTNSNIIDEPSFTIYSQDKSMKYCETKPIFFQTGQILRSNLERAGYKDTVIAYIYNGEGFLFAGWSKGSESNITPFIKHNVPAIGPQYQEDNIQIQINQISSVEGRYYALEMDSEGRGFVNVPWVAATQDSVKNPYPLHIGSKRYDGSEEVSIGVYDGDAWAY